jgi:hypothetical protein
MLNIAQVRARIGTELLGKPAPHLLVVPQRIARSATAVQGEHDLTGQALVRGDTVGRLDEDPLMLPKTQPQVVAVQQDGLPLEFQLFADSAQPQ